jgi:hypothetical protein
MADNSQPDSALSQYLASLNEKRSQIQLAAEIKATTRKRQDILRHELSQLTHPNEHSDVAHWTAAAWTERFLQARLVLKSEEITTLPISQDVAQKLPQGYQIALQAWDMAFADDREGLLKFFQAIESDVVSSKSENAKIDFQFGLLNVNACICGDATFDEIATQWTSRALDTRSKLLEAVRIQQNQLQALRNEHPGETQWFDRSSGNLLEFLRGNGPRLILPELMPFWTAMRSIDGANVPPFPASDIEPERTAQALEAVARWCLTPPSLASVQARTPPEATPSNRHSPDFRSAQWCNRQFSFTASQAAVVRVLWEAFYNGTPEVGDATLLEAAESESKRLSDLFPRSDAWGTMIVAGSTQGTHRLVEI